MNASVISTFRCNAKCHMCNIWKHPSDTSREITPEIVEKLPDGLGRINLSGGEPCLREDFEKLVSILHSKCKKLEISTNGFYTEKLVRIAEKFPDVMIRISLEGLPALNDKLRGTNNGFDHALRSMLELKKTKIKDIGFSVVICDKNISDLVNLYDLAVGMNVEFAQSTMHNSWYFHKTDNMIDDNEAVALEMRKFMAALLTSKRSSYRLRAKDWLRAFFNLRIFYHAMSGFSKQGNCSAGTDLFFLDPFGNIAPCNGSDSEWIMGNLRENSFEEIWNSPQAIEMRRRVKSCKKDCAFIGTARFDMLRNPMPTLSWIIKNKIRLMGGKPIQIDEPGDSLSLKDIENIPVIETEKDEELIIK